MRTASPRGPVVLLMLSLGALLLLPAGGAGGTGPAQRPRAGRGGGRVYKARITPHWFHGDTRFWYRNDLREGAREFIVVDAEKGTRDLAFDHKKLAVALTKAAGNPYVADKLPFDAIEFVDDDKAIRFKVSGTNWKCEISTYECSKDAGAAIPSPADSLAAEGFGDDLWPDGLHPEQKQSPQQGARIQ